MITHLITHAHTQQEPERDSREWVLSEQGLAQAEALVTAPFWARAQRSSGGVSAMIISSEPKTRLTAEPAARRYGLPIYEDSRLDELQRGGWIEAYADAVAAALAAPEHSIAGWEPAQAALARALEAIRYWEATYPEQQIAIVGHGISLSLVRAWVLQQSHVDLRAWRTLPFGAWATVDMAQRKIIQDFLFGAANR